MKYLLTVLMLIGSTANAEIFPYQDSEDFYNCVEDANSHAEIDACYDLHGVYETDESENAD